MPRRIATLALSLAFLGCSLGTMDNPGGGDSNLPTLGAGPFGKPLIDFDTPAEEPFVVIQPLAQLYEPAVLDRSDGGFRLWFSRQADDEDTVEIWTTEVPSIYQQPDVALAPALVADQDWEEGRVGAPAVVSERDGNLLMLYEGGMTRRHVGLARSTDGGATWTKSPDNPVILDAFAPAIGATSDGFLAVFSRPGDETSLYAADSNDAESWTSRDQPIIEARLDDAAAFDRQTVMSPSLTIQETAAGRLHFGLHFGGRNRNGDASIGYAASYDGLTWERFFGSDPVLSDNPPEELGPSLIIRGSTAFLFFSQPRQLRGAIAVAIHP